MGYHDTLLFGREVEDLICAVPWHWQSNANSEFYRGARELWPRDEVVWQMALSYDAVMAFAARAGPASRPGFRDRAECPGRQILRRRRRLR